MNMELIEVGKTKHYEIDIHDPLGYTYFEYTVTRIISKKEGLIEIFDGQDRRIIHNSELTTKPERGLIRNG